MFNQTYKKIIKQLGLTEDPANIIDLCAVSSSYASRAGDDAIFFDYARMKAVAMAIHTNPDVWKISSTRVVLEDTDGSMVIVNAVMVSHEVIQPSKVDTLILHQLEVELCSVTEEYIALLDKIDSIADLAMPRDIHRFVLELLRAPELVKREIYQSINHDVRSDLYNHDSDAYSGKFLSHALSTVSGNDIGLSIRTPVIISELSCLYQLLYDVDITCRVLQPLVARNYPISLHIHGTSHAVGQLKYKVFQEWYHDMQRFTWRNRKTTNSSSFGNALHLTLDCLLDRLEEDISNSKSARSASAMTKKHLFTVGVRLLTQWSITELWWDHSSLDVSIFDIMDQLEQKVSSYGYRI